MSEKTKTLLFDLHEDTDHKTYVWVYIKIAPIF